MSQSETQKRPATVQEIMIPLSEHPHVPYWLTVRQAMVVLREIALEQDRGKYYEPTLLVFDQEYRLLGILRRRHLLAAVDPRLMDHTNFQAGETAEGYPCLYPQDGCLLHCLSDREVNEAGFHRQVSEFMTPIRAVAAPGDCIVKAFHTMLQADVALLPVMDQEQVLGVVRWTDLFNEVIGMLLER